MKNRNVALTSLITLALLVVVGVALVSRLQRATDPPVGTAVVAANATATTGRPTPTASLHPTQGGSSGPTQTNRPTTVAGGSGRTNPTITATTGVRQPTVAPTVRSSNQPPPTVINDRLPQISYADLPAQAKETIRLIDQHGPFPYDRDGVVFGNRERLLPLQPDGYYHEYTVVTPGSADRGARRIIAGRAGELYYTDDHYESFRRVIR